MPAPVIDPESSVLSYPQWAAWEHQFSASPAETSWVVASGSFPTGMTFQPNWAVTGTSSGNTINLAAHGFANGTLFVFAALAGGSGLATATRYYVVGAATNTFQLSLTPGGTVAALTTDISAAVIFRPGYLVGTATVPGISTVRLTATNGSGTSPEVLFTIGIEPGAPTNDANVDVLCDVVSKLVNEQTDSTVTTVTAVAPNQDNTPGVVLGVKENDDLMLRLRFVKAGTIVDLPVTDLKLVIKEFEPDKEVGLSTAWVKEGSGTGASYLLYTSLTGTALAGSLSNYEADKGTAYLGIADLEVTFSNPESIGPDTLTFSSVTFGIRIERDLGAI
jgi:hypothetical protein